MATKKKSTHKKSGRSAAAQTGARKQVHAVILLAVAVLAFCFAVIPGEAVWTWIHNVLLGLFSFSAYVLPALLTFVSIMLALEKDTSSVTVRVWQSGVFTVLLNSTVYAFFVNSAEVGYWRAIAQCFIDGKSYKGGGALGAILGWPFERMFGDTGAKIILILLTVVFLMLVTGTTILSVMRAVKKPVEKTRETIETANAFIQQQGYSFPIYYDTTAKAAMTYGAYSIPTSYFINAQGHVVARAVGAINAATLQKGIDMISD